MGHHNNLTTTTSVTSATENLQLSPGSTDSQPGDDFADTSNAAVKREWRKAVHALYRGDQDEALRLMSEFRPRFQDSALFHRLDGMVSVKAAGMGEDPNEKKDLLRDALESARKAASLSPESIEFAYFYVNLLYDAATAGRDYEEISRECDRALAIDVEQEEDEEARIAQLQVELRMLRQKANMASISLWMQNEGANGSDRFQLRKLETNPMPNDTKKAIKTREERRKYMEDLIATATLMEQEVKMKQNAQAAKIDSA